jgi:probable HAF family extracellular repeat protein
MTATSTSPFGCNDNGEIVGSFTDTNGNVHGFLFVEVGLARTGNSRGISGLREDT